jgi:hypothetical protein
MRVRGALGLIAGAMMILGGAAHSFLGWPGLGARLAAVPVSPDLVLVVRVAWHFGGLGMLVFGVVAVAQAVHRLRGLDVWALPGQAIAAAYLGFGLWALVVSDFNLFFMVFVVPGTLLAISALPWGGRRGGSPRS